MNRRKFLSATAAMFPLHQLIVRENEVMKGQIAYTKSEQMVLKTNGTGNLIRKSNSECK